MKNLNPPLKSSPNLQTPRIVEALNQSLAEEINIYHQAYLNLERPLMQTSVIHGITKYEYPISFKLQGDIEASIFCILDTYNKKIKESEKSLFQSLYIESMNILLGRLSTNLENNNYYSTVLSAPITLQKDLINKVVEEKNTNILYLTTGYKLTYNTQEFDCRILINIKKQKFFTEV